MKVRGGLRGNAGSHPAAGNGAPRDSRGLDVFFRQKTPWFLALHEMLPYESGVVESIAEPPPMQAPARTERYLRFRGVAEHAVAAGSLVIVAPVLAILCVAIKATSRGPAFFRQVRVGKGGREFHIVKLRTMVTDAERATGPVWATRDDPRVTPLGRFLRASHVDELPQLFNVMLGSMSFVGPRPERPAFVEMLSAEVPDYRARLAVRPGITGLAQVTLDADATVRDVRRKVAYDLLYIRRACLMADLGIVFLTLRRCFRRALT